MWKEGLPVGAQDDIVMSLVLVTVDLADARDFEHASWYAGGREPQSPPIGIVGAAVVLDLVGARDLEHASW
jgi:hypothetical protein